MNKIFRALTGAGLALVIAVGGAAVTAPDASAASRGTVTKAEGRKVIKQGDRQRCLTLKETRKIVKGTGTQTYTNAGGFKQYSFKGKRGSGVRTLVVAFYSGCAYYGELEYRNGQFYSFWNDRGVDWNDWVE